MKFTEVKYSKRFNDGNYEHTEISIAAQVDGDDVVECVSQLKEAVYSSRNQEATGETAPVKDSAPVEEAEEEQEEIIEKPKRNKKPKVEEEVEAEAEEETEEEEAEAEEEQEEEVDDKKKKRFRSKAAPYDRTNEVHRSIFLGALKEIDQKWNSSDAKKARAKKVSVNLDGTDFLDKEGEILPGFVKEMRKAFTGK